MNRTSVGSKGKSGKWGASFSRNCPVRVDRLFSTESCLASLSRGANSSSFDLLVTALPTKYPTRRPVPMAANIRIDVTTSTIGIF